MTDPTDTLEKRLLQEKRARLITDCERLVDDEVASKGGLSGLAIKGAYKVVCSVKPGIIRDALEHLADDFVRRLEPLWSTHRDASGGDGRSFGDFLTKRPAEVADALLGITDEKARHAKNPVLKSTYDKLRPQAKKHVEDAIPRVARTLSGLL